MKMKWKVHELRRDKRTGVLMPVRPSKYYKYLLKQCGDKDESRKT